MLRLIRTTLRVPPLCICVLPLLCLAYPHLDASHCAFVHVSEGLINHENKKTHLYTSEITIAQMESTVKEFRKQSQHDSLAMVKDK